MCGICGIVNYRSGEPADARTVRAMVAAMIHRGPDDEGFHFDDEAALGMRRLSIIDLAGGAQPISNERRSIWVVSNGEIYNFRELRRELESHGHLFTTRSDTEVIVHAYEQWGLESFARLNGMFGTSARPGEGPVRGQASLLPGQRLGARLRVRAPLALLSPAGPSRSRSSGAPGVRRPHVRPVPPDGVRGGEQAAARPPPRVHRRRRRRRALPSVEP